jgi:hypothetical protein
MPRKPNASALGFQPAYLEAATKQAETEYFAATGIMH